MNAHKLASITILASAGLILAACGNTTASTLKRADAIVVLNKINAAVTAKNFTAPTTLTQATSATAGAAISVSYVDGAKSFVHTVYSLNSTINSVVVAANTEIFGYKNGDSYVLAKKEGTAISYYEGADVTAAVGYSSYSISGAAQSRLSVAVESAGEMAKYLKDFNYIDKTDSSLAAGGTDLTGKATMKAESYSSTGDDNVVLDITPRYYNTYDEHMVYTYAKNLLVSSTNDHSGSKVAYTWNGTVNSTFPTLTGATTLTAAEAAALVVLL